ncbi:MAG TPA: ABC transporter permease [Vicinamibacterales bacterium]|nr:ABC transporter permease [Vicinamibacterales bacterium]
MRDLRDAIRQWARTPVITAVVVLSLALGIGANTAIFSLIDSLLIKSLPVREPNRLVRVTEPNYNTLGVPVFRQITATEVFESTAAMSLLRPDISNTLERRSAFGLAMNGGFFDTLGVSPAIGRLLTPEDDAVGAAAVAVTDYEFWQTEYGGRPDILGATIRLDGKPFTIVGVTERGFFGLNVGRRFDVAIAFNGYRTLFPDALDGIRNSFAVVGRLRDGQTAASAEAALRTLQPGIRAALQMPDNVPFLLKPVNVTSIASGLSTTTQEQYSKPLAVLMALVALVLVIACTNVANLLIARGSARRGELAVRLSLGASRGQVLRSLLIESLVIALASAGAALIVGGWTARAIVNAVAVNQSGGFANWIAVPLDYRVMAFTIGVGCLTAIVFGIGPAWWATRVDPLDAMRQRARGLIGGSNRFGIAQALVAFQVALAFVLVFGGSLLIRSFVSMTSQDLGFDRRHVVVAVPDFSRSRVARRERVPVTDRIREQLRAFPGVQDVSFVESSPFGFGTGLVPFTIDGGNPVDGQRVMLNRVSDGYFRTMGVAVTAGRDFDWIGREPRQSAIVNDAFAAKYLSGRSALGQPLRMSVRGHPSVEIVGVVANSRHTSLRDAVEPTVFVPMLPEDEPWIEINIRSRIPETQVHAAVLEIMSELAPGASVEFRSIETGFRYAAARDRVIAALAGSFAALALLLSAIGLYGVMSHQVIRRRQEFGVRVAIGAAPGSVTALILKQAAWIIGLGVAVGLAGALASGRLIAALLFDVTPSDPASIAIAAAFLSAVTVLAGLIPARRAARVDPMIALREE